MITSTTKATVRVGQNEMKLATADFCQHVCGELNLDGCLCGREGLGLIPQGTAQALIQLAIDGKFPTRKLPEQAEIENKKE